MTPLLELERVGYHQKETKILVDIDWSVASGQRWAVLGPNGCGKTTLLRVATGFLWQSSGTVRRCGKEMTDLFGLRTRMSWVSPDLMTRVPPAERAVETVVSGRRGQVGLRQIGIEDWPTQSEFAEAYAMLEAMGLTSLAEKPVRVLSQG